MSAPATANPDRETDKPPRRRRWIPLSLRMFVVTMSLTGVGSALWIGIPAYRQRSAIREMKENGGKIYRSKPVGPAWLRRIVGLEGMRAFDEIESIGFLPLEETFWEKRAGAYSGPTAWTNGTVDVNDATLRCVRGFPRLKQLDLSYTNVGDGGISHVAELRNLEFLNLEYTEVSDSSIPLLKKLARLKDLQLRQTKMTDEGVAELRRALPSLEIEK